MDAIDYDCLPPQEAVFLQHPAAVAEALANLSETTFSASFRSAFLDCVLLDAQHLQRGPVFMTAGQEQLREIYRERRVLITDSEGSFRVRGSAGAAGGNSTLQDDIRGFAADSQSMAALAAEDCDPSPEQLRLLKLLAEYYNWVHSKYDVTEQTEAVFQEARSGVIAALGPGQAALVEELQNTPLAELAPNAYLYKVAEAIDFPATQADYERRVEDDLRRVQPAAVKLRVTVGESSWGGSGVNISAKGIIITNAHVANSKDQRVKVSFPNGQDLWGVCTAIDDSADIAVVELEGVQGLLPFAAFEDKKPDAGEGIVCIGNPSGRDPWHVSVGEIVDNKPSHPWISSQGSELGGLAHNAWTYWGHSGSPLFDFDGEIVGLHNSWDSATALRHGVPYDALIEFLDQHDVGYTVSTDD